MPVITYREALRAAMSEEIERDPNVILLGEEVGQFNGAYKVSEGMLAKYGPTRVIDTPISEAGFIGLGVGAAMLGLRPVMELMFFSFYSVAFDQIFNNAANIRYMSGGLIHCPIVLRGPANGGTNVGATHSHTPESIAAYHPGIKVVVPSNAADAKGLLKSAIRDPDPVLFMENTLLYGESCEVPDGEHLVPLGQANLLRPGTHLSIIGHGRTIQLALQAARILQETHGVDAEILDLRSIRPLDEEAILASVRKTNRALYVEEAKPFCSVGAMVAALIQEKAFDDLDGPVRRLTSLDAPAIYSPPLEKIQIPSVDRIVAAALEALK